MKPTVLTLLALALSILACSPSQDKILEQEASAVFKRADDLQPSATCELRLKVAEGLTLLDDKIELALDDPDNNYTALESLQEQTSERYHTLIRTSYDNKCCWAIGMIVECAEKHPNELTQENLRALLNVKRYYSNNCCQHTQTAML